MSTENPPPAPGPHASRFVELVTRLAKIVEKAEADRGNVVTPDHLEALETVVARLEDVTK